MIEVVSVVFEKNGKSYYFSPAENKYEKDDIVLVETERGLQLANIVQSNLSISSDKIKSPLKTIIRKATEKDLKKEEKNKADAVKALLKCKELVEEYQLQMRMIDAVYNFDRSQLVFHFLADKRVDFRELVKKLASLYHTRIELRQVGVRDKAKEVGGLGICGRKLCCSNHLKDFNSVSINMAKNQNISLNPNKINGVCGRLLCCLMYEDSQYTECKKCLPKKGEFVKTKYGKGKVISIDLLNKSYNLQLANGDIKTVENPECSKTKE